MFFMRLIFGFSMCLFIKRKLFKILYYINMRFNFLQSCHYYILENDYLDSITNENNKEHHEKWPFIPDHPYRISIIGVSGSEKTNALFSLIKEGNDIDEIYLYAKDLSERKY